MTSLYKNKVIVDFERAAKLGLAKGFLSMGKALHEIRQKEIFKIGRPGYSFSKFCAESESIPGAIKYRYLLATKMIKIISELSIYRQLKDGEIFELGFDKAYDLARFSQTHSERDLRDILAMALKMDFKKLRKFISDKQAKVSKIEITTVSYDSEGKETGRNRREIKR